MKTLLLIAICIPLAYTAVVDPIVRETVVDNGQGVYDVFFESKFEELREKGGLKQLPGDKGPVNVKSGYFTYIAPNKKKYHVSWTSDERGFLAQGDHLPTTPKAF